MALGELRHGASARRVTLNSRVDPGQIRAGAEGRTARWAHGEKPGEANLPVLPATSAYKVQDASHGYANPPQAVPEGWERSSRGGTTQAYQEAYSNRPRCPHRPPAFTRQDSLDLQ